MSTDWDAVRMAEMLIGSSLNILSLNLETLIEVLIVPNKPPMKNTNPDSIKRIREKTIFQPKITAMKIEIK